MITMDHDAPFGLRLTPSENDVCYMACLHKEKVRDLLFDILFDYHVCPYTFSLVDYFVRGLKVQPHIEEIIIEVAIDGVDELQHMLHQLHVGDGTPSASTSMIIPPPSLDQGNLFSLCFPEKTTNYRIVIKLVDMIDGVIPHDMLDINQFLDATQQEPLSPLKLFGLSVIEIAEEVQTVHTPRLPT